MEPQADPDGAIDVESGRVVQNRARHVAGCDEEADLGASENDALSAPGDKVAHDPQVLPPGAVVDDPAGQLLEGSSGCRALTPSLIRRSYSPEATPLMPPRTPIVFIPPP